MSAHGSCPPTVSHDEQEEQADNGQRAEREEGGVLWALQEEGDTVCVPHGWWHCVLNLAPSVAYT